MDPFFILLQTGTTIFSSRSNKVALLLLGLLAACLLTAPSIASAFKVAAAGDISCPADSTAQNVIEPGLEPKPAAAKCQGRQVARMIAAEGADVALAVGDLIQGQESLSGAYADFQEAWGNVLGSRVVSSLGNHDYHRDEDGLISASGYFDYWEQQDAPAWRYGKPGKGWSSWNAGKWHMINLNSNCRVSDCTFTGPQLRWLINDLKQDRANPATECTLAYFHHPLFSAGVPLGRTGDRTLVTNLWELLYRYRTDLVVTGHQHFYERYFPQNPTGERDETGITQIISGTGGASTFHTEDEAGNAAANSAASVRSLGATFLDLENGSYSTYFRDRLGKVHDPVEPKQCLKPNAGQEQRAPRARRYTAHMKRMARLDRRINGAQRSLRKLNRSKAAPSTLKKIKSNRSDLIRKRNQLRYDRLY